MYRFYTRAIQLNLYVLVKNVKKNYNFLLFSKRINDCRFISSLLFRRFNILFFSLQENTVFLVIETRQLCRPKIKMPLLNIYVWKKKKKVESYGDLSGFIGV